MQASNLDQLQSGLIALIEDGFKQAADQAAATPDRFQKLIAQVLDDAGSGAEQLTEIPADVWKKLKRSAEDPDWLGLLLSFAVILRDAVGDEVKVGVGAYDPGDGWSRALALTFTKPVAGGTSQVDILLAIGDGVDGIIVQTSNNPRFDDVSAGSLKVGIKGDGNWRFPFGRPVEPPAGAASLTVDIRLNRDLLPSTGKDISIGVGSPRLSASFKAAVGEAVAWHLDFVLDSTGPDTGGMHAKVDLGNFLGALSGVFQIAPIDEEYSPELRLSSAAAPVFNLRRGA